ncbi:MAG: trypsin-like serine protease [Bacteroidetes bacterium]|nr:trypsin-like serine protease [Bacteroidota bacterium]
MTLSPIISGFRRTSAILLATIFYHQVLIAQVADPNLIPLPRNGNIGVLKVLPVKPIATENYTRPEKPLQPSEIADFNRPATVQVVADVKVNVQYPQPFTFNMVLLSFDAKRKAETGEIENSDFSIINYMLNQIALRPAEYFRASLQLMQAQVRFTSTGSGAFITPDGYLVTNAHVVQADAQRQKSNAATQVLGTLVGNELDKQIQQYGGRVDENIYNNCVASIFNEYAKYIRIVSHEVDYFIKTGKTMENESYQLDAKLITMGSEIPGKDVAILKVEGNNFPTVALGDDTKLKAGDKLYVMGYPGVVETHSTLKENKMREPSFTEGMMNARQETSTGWTAIQLDAATYRGNSGGPVFNTYGEVVGLLTFGSLNEDKSALVQGFNFIVPTSVVSGFIRSSNITPTMGESTIWWREAQMLVSTKAKKSNELLQQIALSNTDWPYLLTFRNEVNDALLNQKDPWYKAIFTQFGLKWYQMSAVIIALLYGLAWIIRKIFK